VATIGTALAILPHTEHADSAWEKAGAAGPCLRCLFENAPPPGANPTCDTAGVIATVVAIVASFQVNEALKILTGNYRDVSTAMLSVDVWSNTFHQFKVAGAYEHGDCPCCRHRRFEHLEGRFSGATTTLCGRDAVQLRSAANGQKPDLRTIADRLAPHATVKVNEFLLRANLTDAGKPYELTLFPDGRAIIKGTQQPNVARTIYARYIGA
jgi:adenylyltransferase/sulfurtransferase